IYRSWQLGQADTVADDEADIALRERSDAEEDVMDDEGVAAEEAATTDFVGVQTAPITVLHMRDHAAIDDDAPVAAPRDGGARDDDAPVDAPRDDAVPGRAGDDPGVGGARDDDAPVDAPRDDAVPGRAGDDPGGEGRA